MSAAELPAVERFRRAAGLAWARWQYRRRRLEPVSFTHAVSEARHALLILPFNSTELPPLAPVLETLRRKFQDKHITVVTTLPSVELMRMLPQGRFVRIEPSEITPLYAPRAGMMQRMPRPAYDLAIDLNLDFILPSGYICRESNARVRIGCAGRQSDLFYNLLIQTHPDPGRPHAAYERLAGCLEMF